MKNLGQIMPRECEIVFRSINVIARSEATRQSILSLRGKMDCFASLAMTADDNSTRTRPLRRRVHRVDRLARGHEQAVALDAAEAEVGAAFGQRASQRPSGLIAGDML